jgi:hypothetical protein
VMNSIPDKFKQLVILSVKVCIVASAFYFIYAELANNKSLDWTQFYAVLGRDDTFLIGFFILLLSFLNRYIEVLKWKNLASNLLPTSTYQSFKEVFSALTAGLFTPNGIGEYAGKALYYPKAMATSVFLYNFVCNGVQMIYTLSIGILSIIVFNYKYHFISDLYLIGILALLVGIGLLLFFLRKISIGGYSIVDFVNNINKIPKKRHLKNFVLGFFRYLTIVNQYYLFFIFFGYQIPYLDLITACSCVYLLGSVVPNFQFLDFAVRGGVSIFIFGFLDINTWVIVFVAMLIWLLNIVIPVLIGCVFVIQFKPRKVPDTNV